VTAFLGALGALVPGRPPSGHGTRHSNQPPAWITPRKTNEEDVPRGLYFFYNTRLSATDISALASMKNVAKCDTWCELQNPANHRVFERKLRQKPLGRRHVCLGVSQRIAPNSIPWMLCVVGGRWPPVYMWYVVGLKVKSLATDRHDAWWLNDLVACRCRRTLRQEKAMTLARHL
jgi:hypothetical protein